MHHAASLKMFAGLQPSQALKTYFDVREREHGCDTACIYYKLCIKTLMIDWLIEHLPSCLPYTVRDDQVLNSLY